MTLSEMISGVYYHATYKPLLDSIMKNGLNNRISKKSWQGSGNYVYLSTDKNVAESYAETSDVVPEEWLDQIIILKIDGNGLKKDKLSTDKNNKQGDTLQYDEKISPKFIEVLKK